MNKCFVSIVSSCIASSLLLAQDPSQKPGSQQPPTTTQQPGERSVTNSNNKTHADSDAILVTWLVVDNENEIALSRIAVQKAQNPDVKQFAQRMIDEHGAILQKLQQASTTRVGQKGARDATGTGTARDTTETGATGTGNRDTTGKGTDPKGEYPSGTREGQPRDASVAAMGIDHERLVRDLGRKCLESSTKMLNEKQGAEFDRCFMAMQLGAHMKAVGTIEVFKTYASESLKPTLDEGLKTVQMHLQHAKDLAKRTEVASADVTTRR